MISLVFNLHNLFENKQFECQKVPICNIFCLQPGGFPAGAILLHRPLSPTVSADTTSSAFCYPPPSPARENANVS